MSSNRPFYNLKLKVQDITSFDHVVIIAIPSTPVILTLVHVSRTTIFWLVLYSHKREGKFLLTSLEPELLI